MANSVSENLTNRLYAIADVLGTTVYLDKGSLQGQVSHMRNFSGVKIKHALTILESALTADKSAALVRGPGNLLFLVMKADGTKAQLHLLDAAKIDGDPAEIFAQSKINKDASQKLLAGFVTSFTQTGVNKWEQNKKAN